MRKSELRRIIREEIVRAKRLNEMYSPKHWKNFVRNGYFVFEKMPEELIKRIWHANYGSHSTASNRVIYNDVKRFVRENPAKDIMEFVNDMETGGPGDSFASDNYGL